jgi:CheY-like chemotaxis protein
MRKGLLPQLAAKWIWRVMDIARAPQSRVGTKLSRATGMANAASLAGRRHAPPSRQSEKKPPMTQPLPRVLIVDDEASIRETVRVALEEEGYGTLEASDGMVAMKILRTSAESLVVLLDLLMWHMNGAEVLRALAEDPDLAGRHAYIVMTAQQRGVADETYALIARFAIPVLAKPFDITELYDAVAEAARRLAVAAQARAEPHE